VAAVPSPLPDPADERVDLVFGALADPTRRHLIELLAAEPGATATGLAATMPISRQAVAKHLKLLHEAGLVSSRRRGREALFELDPEPLGEAVAWIGAVGAEWDRRLDGLRRLLSR
jgi:DNA-binding transcriptional ArsR family regulator